MNMRTVPQIMKQSRELSEITILAHGDLIPSSPGYLSLFFCYIETEGLVDLVLHLPEECSELVCNRKSDATIFFTFSLTR